MSIIMNRYIYYNYNDYRDYNNISKLSFMDDSRIVFAVNKAVNKSVQLHFSQSTMNKGSIAI